MLIDPVTVTLPTLSDTEAEGVAKTLSALRAIGAGINNALTVLNTVPVNQPPSAAFTVTNINGLTASFDASASDDPDGTIVAYRWVFGDGVATVTPGPVTTHNFPATGSYPVTLTVTDNNGDTDAASAPVSVTAPADPTPPVSTFTLRKTKPNSTNIGTGVTGPVTATLVASTSSTAVNAPGGSFQNGVYTISQAGYVLKDTYIKARKVAITGSNVALINCKIEGTTIPPSGDWIVTGKSTTVLSHCDITTTVSTYLINGYGGLGTLEYCDISKVIDPVDPFGTGTIIVRGCYLHDFQFASPDPTHKTVSAPGSPHDGEAWSHDDGIQFNASGITGQVYGNTIDARWSNTIGSLPLPTTQAQLAAIMLNNVGSVAIEDNWFNGGQATINALGLSTGTVNLKRNRFGRNFNFGRYPIAVSATASSRVVTNDGTTDQNVYEDDGTAVSVYRNG
jgi:PKD domain-containing protein